MPPEQRVLMGPKAGRGLLLFSMLVVALLVGALVAAALLLTSASREIAIQQVLRQADGLRFEILEMQLDEETGLRGFELTHDAFFLEPALRARVRLPVLVSRETVALQRADPSGLRALNAERSLNAEWNARILEPALRNGGASTHAQEVLGKTLVDRVRDENFRIEASLANVARAFDVRSAQFVVAVTRWTLGFVVVIALVFLYYLWVQTRLLLGLELHAEAVERERTISRSLQKAFLFETLPSSPTITFGAVYKPADVEGYVGGDWYGAMGLRDGRIFFTVGDVSGHGIHAAVTMARTRQTILAASVLEADPAVALARANEVMRLRGDFFVTAICGYVDLKRGTFAYASAGHVPPLLVSPGGIATFLPTHGLPLGFVDDPRCRSFERAIEPGSMLVLYTDGLVEFDRDILRGQERLARSAPALLSEDPNQRAAALVERVLEHNRQFDDVAVLVVSFSAVPVSVPQEVVHS
jgi:CHASE3 domain sensor protein